MPLILSLETSTDVCSVALHNDGRLEAEEVLKEPQAHASQLATLIDRVIRKSNRHVKELRAVAISKGPGSYTGLRIGTSTAKGICYALDIPLIAIGTLELLAYQGSKMNADGKLLCPMIDARRMEVYCLVAAPDLTVVEPIAARIIDADSFSELLRGRPMLFFGNGSDKCRDVIRHGNASFADGVYPSAASLGELAERKFTAADFEDSVQFKPFYLKEFVAKRAGTGV